MFKRVFSGLCPLVILLAVMVLTPVPFVSEDKAIVERGIVKNIWKDGVKDIVFKLEKNPRKFYMNRGFESRLNLEKLREKLIGNEVVFKYPRYWTPLDWNDQIRHLSKVEYGEEEIFNELKPPKQ